MIKKLLHIVGYPQWKRLRRARRDFTVHTVEDQERVDFYKQFMGRSDLVFDVGANMGNRSKVFLALGCRVVAAEPQGFCARFLDSVLGGNKGFSLEKVALGPDEGMAVLMLSNSHHLSSMSQEWVDAVVRSGRFSEYRWDRRQKVEVTTLDKLVEKHGQPRFIKIDVEGFESEVIRGLSRSVEALSFEFTPEHLESTVLCLRHLESLSEISCNFALGECMRLQLDEWVSPEDLILRLRSVDQGAFGDVYIRRLPDVAGVDSGSGS